MIKQKWTLWEPVDGIDRPDDRGGPELGPNASVGTLERAYEPEDAALRELLRLLKEVGRE